MPKIFFSILLLVQAFYSLAQAEPLLLLERLLQKLHPPVSENQPGLFFSLFTAEMAIAQGDYAAGAQFYLDAALQSNQVNIAQRAFALSLRIKNPETMYRAALRWQALAKENPTVAWHTVAALLWQQKVSEAAAVVASENLLFAEHSAGLAAVVEEHYAQGLPFATLQSFFNTLLTKPNAQAVMPLVLAYARLALAEKNPELAKKILAQAAEKAPENGDIIILQATLYLELEEVGAAIALLQQGQARLPENLFLKQYLFDVLIEKQQHAEAYDFLPVLLNHPAFHKDPELYYTAGLLALGVADYVAADGFFQKVLSLDPQGEKQPIDNVLYLLGQTAEQRQDWPQAWLWYEKVSGDLALEANLRQAVVRFKQNDLTAALALLQNLLKESEDREARKQIYIYQADILEEAQKPEQALVSYEQALQENPGDVDLLYAQGLLAERLENLVLFEKNMREILERDPESANAYNALGYTFADRNIRLEEAKPLLEKALALEPDSAAIIDSVGWLYFRLGDINQAKAYIERAHQMLVDPEIMAHLAEIYLLEGKVAEAEALFKDALEKFPDSPYLLRTLKRLRPDLLPTPASRPKVDASTSTLVPENFQPTLPTD